MRAIVALSLALCSSALSADGSIAGVVEDRITGRPVAGAEVRLLESGASDTTDEVGRFSLQANTSVAVRTSLASPRFVPGRGILFSRPVAGRVRMEILDFAGRLVATPCDANLDPGTWSVPLGRLPDGIYLCRIMSAEGTRTLRFVQSETVHSPEVSARRTGEAVLARLLAASGRLVTTCVGYVPDTTLLDESSDSVAIRLAPSSAGGRVVQPFDAGWLFFKGDAAGVEKPSFADGNWRKVDVPFDWSIEGPFDRNATTGGYGGFLPGGTGWFRKHFTLPADMAGKRVFVEFDGIMANSSVWINGTHLGTRPNGYVSIRYDLTESLKLGEIENVLAVKADNSLQMASRWYAGAGIYRHVRLIVVDPVHFDKWSTFVTTPTTSMARVSTTVVNQGTTTRSISVQMHFVDPSGTRSGTVNSPVKSIPAGGKADFLLDMPIADARLWSLETPNLYQLVATVKDGGASLDEESTTFGVRTIRYDPETGFFLNGKSVKMKGVCLHHDLGGLGAATPLRAWQRRLAVLKSIGVNAIRTSHNPFDPAVLDLMDRMGFLVMDEFFDVWVGHKYGMNGDYATYFKQWYQTDLTDIVKRDRNHPGIVIYSIGNEIRDALSTRLPYTKTMIAQCHSLDSTRPVTQALFRPKDAGDYPGSGGTIQLFDVFGVNYRNAELLEAITTASPRKPGISTEMGMNPSVWTSFYAKTPQVVGEFIWTGAEYLGEADGAWPTVVGTDGSGTIFGLVDRTSEIKDIGYSYAAVWASKVPVKPKTSTMTAAKLVLTVDHPSIKTDFDDIAYVRASFVDANGNQVSTASGEVTFSVDGSAGGIVAVDNADPASSESFRGSTRKAYKGACYAMVRMRSSGSITIVATAGTLKSAPVTVTGTQGAFAPCAGTCD
jgi:beta-galactosidase